MNFRQGSREEPEINLIPFIDILLVVLIFLMLTTTYSKYTELKVNLPVANAEPVQTPPREITVSIAQDGSYAVDGRVLERPTVDALVSALRAAATPGADQVLVISADAAATHQSVVNVMDAARRTSLQQITFATQQPASR